jgi:hypothetical protein
VEITFTDGIEMELPEGTEVELPDYVHKLPPEDMKTAQSAENRHERVIAAGTDPRDQKITLLTASGMIMIFDTKKYHIPPGPSLPSHAGEKIFLPNVERRWYSPSPGFYVDAIWMLKNSTSGLEGAVMTTNNYSDENKPGQTPSDH